MGLTDLERRFNSHSGGKYRPLAELMRPQTIESFAGQAHLVGSGKPLGDAIIAGHLHSMVLWGPPGSGKTTLARLIAQSCGARFVTFSAVTAGVKDLREVVAESRQHEGDMILFVDEVHRFNKAQQDAFLPHVEDGTIILVGATTENPSFELNNALLSRLRVYALKPLGEQDLISVFENALADVERGLGDQPLQFEEGVRDLLVIAADGDARRLLNYLELAMQLATEKEDKLLVDKEIAANVIGVSIRRFDKDGDYFFDQISALHKSVRGTDPDASLYWFARMLDGGCDPRYLARRLIRMASEDIGNADPRALALALDAAEAYDRLGSPEGELALAQATVYLACAAKSNATYQAFGGATRDAKDYRTLEVPLHLRNAPTALAQKLGYGYGYRYAHDEPDAYAAGENYFPKGLEGRQYYQPVERGLEIRIAEKLARIRAKSRSS